MVLSTRAAPLTSQLLHLCGFSYQKTEKVFKSRRETKVADFEEQLEKN